MAQAKIVGEQADLATTRSFVPNGSPGIALLFYSWVASSKTVAKQ
jgi:hypothetical protein